MVAKKTGTGAGGDQNGDETKPSPIRYRPSQQEHRYRPGLLRKIVDIDGDEVTTMLPPRTVPAIAAAPNHPRLHISDVVSYPQNPYRIPTILLCSSTIAINLFMCLIVWKKYKDDSSKSSRRSHNTTVAIIP
ncbi:hypothetical protein M422DRAFT_254014 [Sphaerobolus stellatus SS14]|uniref:Uncharacterized protein n=1 Tax=Sphaerobolus stellatus (strain SS14) TaxID=990650 RepID=A0A0C9VW43_SPHS4|nr:hypothetical protein M422DRAFT_254014 [Sphaerobolus stellatus SS14]